jgi:hypothetical protein
MAGNLGCRVWPGHLLNSLQDVHFTCATSVFRQQTLRGFIDFICELFDLPGPGAQAVAAIDEQLPLAQIDSRPNIFAGQGLGDPPMLFENIDLTALIHLADEMQPSGSQWQILW